MKKFWIRFKYFINEIRGYYKGRKNKISIDNSVKNVYVFCAADYGNIGDIAITFAQKEFIKRNLPEYNIVEIPTFKVNSLIYFLKRTIKKDDIITIIGGGNMTNRYENIEESRRRIIKNFPDNLIILFPQTIEFTEDIQGQESMLRTQKIYSNHKHIVVFAREKKSYDLMKKIFGNIKIELIPDIVISLKESFSFNSMRTNQIGICIRDDKEKLLNVDITNYITQDIYKNNIKKMSTYIAYDEFNNEKRFEYFYDLLEEISKLNVFITDRLHGMIFAYLTNTPCLVFDNDNHKISETYNMWLKNCNYIKLLNESDINNLEEYIEMISKIEKREDTLIEKFDELSNILKEH